VSRAEVAAALAKAAHPGLVTREAAAKGLQVFGADWSHLMRLEVGKPLIARAAALAWEQRWCGRRRSANRSPSRPTVGNCGAAQRGAAPFPGRRSRRRQRPPSRNVAAGFSAPASVGVDRPCALCHDRIVYFEIIGEVGSVETIATGSGIRELARLRKLYGRARWRKRKGVARVRLEDGEIMLAELHWYEATGIGKREFKIKRFL
jgi:hypothetical protein